MENLEPHDFRTQGRIKVNYVSLFITMSTLSTFNTTFYKEITLPPKNC